MPVASETTYTIAQLERWPLCAEDWPADGTALAVIGHPVAHSLSPVMHNAALGELAKTNPRFSHWRYFKFDIKSGELESALQEFHAAKFHGLNLTVPHKSLAVELRILTEKDAFVRDAGAANTLTYTAGGWIGANTDGYGLATALQQELNVNLVGADIILLGAGGAARGAAIECLRSRCAGLWIGNRTILTRDMLLDDLQPLARITTVRPFDLARPMGLPARAIVINATSLGLGANDPAPVDLRLIPEPACVFDMIYRPAQTALLRQAAVLGLPHANGLAMLVHQGARSLEIWTGAPAPVKVMQAAALAALTPPRA